MCNSLQKHEPGLEATGYQPFVITDLFRNLKSRARVQCKLAALCCLTAVTGLKIFAKTLEQSYPFFHLAFSIFSTDRLIIQ